MTVQIITRSIEKSLFISDEIAFESIDVKVMSPIIGIYKPLSKYLFSNKFCPSIFNLVFIIKNQYIIKANILRCSKGFIENYNKANYSVIILKTAV